MNSIRPKLYTVPISHNTYPPPISSLWEQNIGRQPQISGYIDRANPFSYPNLVMTVIQKSDPQFAILLKML